MRIIIAGGRELRPSHLRAALVAYPHVDAIEEVIVGGAPGIDACAEVWARKRGLVVTRVPADWDRFGKSAGPRRNRIMASLGDALLAIPGEGRGTYNMIAEARKWDLDVFVFDVKKGRRIA